MSRPSDPSQSTLHLLIDHLLRDLRYGLRMLRRSPIFTAVAILSLALGIGANAAIFQLIDTIRLRSLPVANPQELAEVRADGARDFGVSDDPNSKVTYPLWEQIRAHQTAFASMFAWGNPDFWSAAAPRRGRRAASGSAETSSRCSASPPSAAGCSDGRRRPPGMRRRTGGGESRILADFLRRSRVRDWQHADASSVSRSPSSA